METSLKGKNLPPEPLRVVSYDLENNFYYIGCPPFNVAIFITHEVLRTVMGATSSSMDIYLTLICTDILFVYFDVLRPCQQFFSQVRTGLSGSIQYLAENKVYLLLKDSMQCLW